MFNDTPARKNRSAIGCQKKVNACFPLCFRGATDLKEGERPHESEVADPVEGQGQTHGSSTGLLAEDLGHHDERDRP